jgi:hypothetical protein
MSEAEQECRWSLVKAYSHWRIAQRRYPLHDPRFVYDLGLGPYWEAQMKQATGCRCGAMMEWITSMIIGCPSCGDIVALGG